MGWGKGGGGRDERFEDITAEATCASCQCDFNHDYLEDKSHSDKSRGVDGLVVRTIAVLYTP